MHKKIIPFILICVLSFSVVMPAYAANLKTQFLNLSEANGLDQAKQAVCLEDEEDDIVSYNKDMRIIPASVTKLYVFDEALTKLPADFRYITTFYRSGNTLYINGGGDSHFQTDNLASVIRDISKDSKTKISKFVISPNFYFEWNTQQKNVQMAVFHALKADKTLPIAPRIQVVMSNNYYKGPGTKYQFRSMPLPDLIKQISDYSNNVGAEALFQYMGGTDALMSYIKKTYGVTDETAYFGTGSGLSGNYTTCGLTIKVLKHLNKTITDNGMKLTDVLSVPIIDKGVLAKRLIDADDAKAIVAKSGYINYHHTLAGIINTTDGPIYFGIFTTYPTLAKGTQTKKMIDTYLEKIIDKYRSDLEVFNYKPSLTIGKNVLFKKV